MAELLNSPTFWICFAIWAVVLITLALWVEKRAIRRSLALQAASEDG